MRSANTRVGSLPAVPFDAFEKVNLAAALLLIAGCLAVFWLSPHRFYQLIIENGPVENMSFLAWILASGVCIYVACRHFKDRQYKLALTAAGVGCGFFVLGMEEVSWMQHVLKYETPDIFNTNYQREVNLHNFFTDMAEAFFYTATILFCLLGPLIREGLAGSLKVGRWADFVLPRRTIIWLGAGAAALNYDMWNMTLTQVCFFAALAAIGQIYRQVSNRRERGWVAAYIFVLIAAQAILLLHGNRFVRHYDITEFKEMVLALAFLVYSLELLREISKT